MMSKTAIENYVYTWFVDMVELQELSHNQLKSLANWFVTSPDVDQTRKIPAIKHLREMGDVSPSTGNYNLSLHDAKFLIDNFWQSATFAELLNYRAIKHDIDAELLDYSANKMQTYTTALANHITDLRTRINLLRPVDTTRDVKDVLYALNMLLIATGELEGRIPNLTIPLRTARNAIANELGIH